MINLWAVLLGVVSADGSINTSYAHPSNPTFGCQSRYWIVDLVGVSQQFTIPDGELADMFV